MSRFLHLIWKNVFSATPSLQCIFVLPGREWTLRCNTNDPFFAGPLLYWEDITTCYTESANSVLTVYFLSQ